MDENNQRWLIVLFGALALIFAAVLLFRSDQAASVASLVAGIVALCALLAFFPLLGSVKSFGFGPTGLTLERIDVKVQETRTELNAAREKIDRFIFLAMPLNTYQNLKKLSSPTKGDGNFVLSDGFRQQLRYLRDGGYITIDGGSVTDLTDGNDVSRQVSATSLGREFIEYREKLIAS